MNAATIARNGANGTGASPPAVFLTVQRFCHDRSLSKSTFYNEVKAGRIKPVKRGRRTLVHQDEAQRYDASLVNATP
ncbi:hypothetical protein BH10PSE6_BH10PSE6_11650 [soil metagenome]